jgi:hypothetical protein
MPLLFFNIYLEYARFSCDVLTRELLKVALSCHALVISFDFGFCTSKGFCTVNIMKLQQNNHRYN